MPLSLEDPRDDLVLVENAIVVPPPAESRTRQQKSGVLTADGSFVENSISWGRSTDAVNAAPDMPDPDTIEDLPGTWTELLEENSARMGDPLDDGGAQAAMQAVTTGAVADIRGIGGTIGEMNEITTTIAAAVEEQSAATAEISRNVAQAATGTGEVTDVKLDPRAVDPDEQWTLTLACDMPRVADAARALIAEIEARGTSRAPSPASEATDSGRTGTAPLEAPRGIVLTDRGILQPLAAVYRSAVLGRQLVDQPVVDRSVRRVLGPLWDRQTAVRGLTDDVDTWDDVKRFGLVPVQD